jgi:hypothetical protein
MRERIYSPQLGQFLQTAPSRIAGDVNLYACVNNDPLNGIDWSGLDYSAEESSLTYVREVRSGQHTLFDPTNDT